MRIIKFRAWNKDKKFFFKWDFSMGFKGTDKIWGPVQQYTGLKDKSGNEIYEGDLLNIPFNGTINEGVHEVFYYKDSFVTSSILFKDKETANKNSLTWMINRNAEVIGNIFQPTKL